MELSGEEGEMALPINITYGHLNHIVPSTAPPPPPPHHHQTPITNGPTMPPPPLATLEDNAAYKNKVVRYRECLKNHAAAMGGSATDGCGEFMPCGEEGTLEALTCSACNCHRNFHRKEIEGEPHHLPIIPTPYDCNYHAAPPHLRLGNGRKLILQGHHPKGSLGTESFGGLVPARTPQPLLMSYNMGIGSLPSDQSDEQEDGGGYMSRHPPPPHHHHHHQMVKKRFRTKFTQEQKEKMLSFAEKVGWKIQKQEESVVQHFCQEVGIKRRVLKVWMHNNKHTLAKKINPISTNPQPQIN